MRISQADWIRLRSLLFILFFSLLFMLVAEIATSLG